MKSMISTILAASGNIAIMMLFAAGKLGPTPVLLPLILAIFSLCCAIALTVLAGLSRKRQIPNWELHLVSAMIWIGMTGFNLWAFQSVLYAA